MPMSAPSSWTFNWCTQYLNLCFLWTDSKASLHKVPQSQSSWIQKKFHSIWNSPNPCLACSPKEATKYFLRNLQPRAHPSHCSLRVLWVCSPSQPSSSTINFIFHTHIPLSRVQHCPQSTSQTWTCSRLRPPQIISKSITSLNAFLTALSKEVPHLFTKTLPSVL